MWFSYYNIFVSLLVIFMLKIDLLFLFLFLFIFVFHYNLLGYMKAEDTGRTDGGRQ